MADTAGASAVKLGVVASWPPHLMHRLRNALAAGCAACAPSQHLLTIDSHPLHPPCQRFGFEDWTGPEAVATCGEHNSCQ